MASTGIETSLRWNRRGLRALLLAAGLAASPAVAAPGTQQPSPQPSTTPSTPAGTRPAAPPATAPGIAPGIAPAPGASGGTQPIATPAAPASAPTSPARTQPAATPAAPSPSILQPVAPRPAAQAAKPAGATPFTPPGTTAAAVHDPLYGDYLAGLQAEQEHDYAVAAQWFEKALPLDPNSPELVTRAFLMAATSGHIESARALAMQVLKLDPDDAIAELVLLIDQLKSGDATGALARAQALPDAGVHRFIAPLALAWTRVATGDLAGAVSALQVLDSFDGFAALKDFQLGLIYDFTRHVAQARANYQKALTATGNVNWRLTEAMANFDRRHGQPEQAKALYRLFVKDNAGSELAESVMAAEPTGPAKPLIGSAADGLAEAMFDLSSILNQPETIDLALLYDRFALALRPNFPLAQLLLADVLSAEGHPQQSLDVLGAIPAGSPYSWSAELHEAVDLAGLKRSDEAIARLQKMAVEAPHRVGAELQLGDLLRDDKRYAEAVDAYTAAIDRSKAAGLPERWSLFYDRGVAYERSGQWKGAQADLEHALALKPDQPYVLNYLGYSWIDRDQHLERGLKMIEKAVALRPDDGYIVDSLGWAHYRLGQYSSAVQLLEKATELVPDDPTINDHLGDAYWRSGRTREARYQWRQALEFGPAKNEIKPIEAKLERGITVRAAPPARGG